MSLQFILGGSGSGKSYYIYEKIIKESIECPNTNYLVIVPEQFTLQTQKDLVSMHPNKGIMNIDVLSFLRLAYRVFEELGGNQRLVLEDTGKSMIVKKVVMEKKNDLILYGANIKKQGFIDEMKSVLSELFQYSIGRDELEQMYEVSKSKPMLQNKLKDIITIYQGFKDFLEDKYITAEEILDVLCDVMDDSNILSNMVICFDGFTGFTPSQYKLLQKLLVRAKKVYVTVTMDEREQNKKQEEHELFYLSGKTIDKLSKLASEARVDIDEPIVMELQGEKAFVPYRFIGSDALCALERNIFRYPYRPYNKEQDDISIIATKDARSEVVHTILTIQDLLRENSYRYRDIAVVTGDIEQYGDLIKREFEIANIPCFIDNKKDIITNPIVEFIRAALEVVEQNFSYESVFRYLKSGLVHWNDEDIDKLENYVIALGIRGKSKWESEWQRVYRTQYEVLIDEINVLRKRFYDEIVQFFKVFQEGNKTVIEYVTGIYNLLLQYEVEEQLEEMAVQFREKNSGAYLQKAKEYDQVYRIVIEVFERIVELLGDECLSVKEFKDILETGFKEAKVGLIPPGVDQIVVGDIERTRLKDIKALFFIGVNDGIVPKANPGGGILNDADRQLFSDYEIELSPTKRQNAYTTEFYIYLNLTKPQKKLYLSYAKTGSDGKALRASYLIGKIKKLFPKIKTKEFDLVPYEERSITDALSTDKGLSYLIEGLRNYNNVQSVELFQELLRVYMSGEIPFPVDKQLILDGLFYCNTETGIAKKVAKKLYGELLLGSVTRMERFAACAFSHFLQYGVLLEERQEFQIMVPDIGNIFHEALELFSKKLKETPYTWHTLPDEVRIELGNESVIEATMDFGNGILTNSKRNEYIINRVARVLQRTIKTLSEQLQVGLFEPAVFEQSFSYADRFLSLRGRIDRIDVYEEGEVTYIKVIDYKSGSTSFDLQSLFYGLQMQLSVYLSAALQMMKEKHPDKVIIPAGVFYYNLDDPIVEKSDHVEEDISKKLSMNGLANSRDDVIAYMDQNFFTDDGLAPSKKSKVIPVETNKNGQLTKRSSVASVDDFEKLLNYVDRLMHYFSKEIMEGKTNPEPYKLKKKSACDYCPYSSVCGFDCRMDGYDYRRLKELSNEEIWTELKERDDSYGNNDLDDGSTKGN